ncbi:hypothetical protein FKR81_38475 [Lentzea tibetensis]|uniref:Streptogrisin C n=1 Tax=Lentzea tibetensis TaxID=2591470 RepID=A0A563EGZ1_9PSEU|nr:hypothetical protein [Lentzea tibetensis]TWP45720.1 hypothetical protein FKR81_38475 [Lentzea tibetensis]
MTGGALAVLTASLISTTPSVAAAQDVPGGFGSWAELTTTQERLNAAGEKILAAQRELGAESGYAGIVAAPESRRLTVYWKGALPGPVTEVVGGIRRELPVDVLPARHSETELLREAARIAARPGVHAVAPEVDGSGLTVTASGVTTAAFDASVPVTVEHGAAMTPAAGKQNDVPPYFGGGLWKGAIGFCSTGFGVRHGGRTKVLSAGHCASNGFNAKDGGDDPMGPVVGDDNAHDTLLIDAPATGSMYTGFYDGIDSRRVSGSSASFVGNLVCRSSARSDESCRIRVVAVNQTINTPDAVSVFPVVVAEQADRTNAGGAGDSGGALFVHNAAGKVTAYGTLSAADITNAPATCTGVVGRQCSWRIAYVDITKSLAAYGASLLTS